MATGVLKFTLAAGLACALAAPAEAKRGKLPPYPKALRCAVLTGAYMRQIPVMSDESTARFDKALFWGLAASEAARKARQKPGQLDRDIEQGIEGAKAELERKDSKALAELDSCLKQVPPLPKKKPGKG